ncbi:MAG: hypothetical protein RLZ55_632, partial [Actinomycetota bacterium]
PADASGRGNGSHPEGVPAAVVQLPERFCERAAAHLASEGRVRMSCDGIRCWGVRG